MVREEHREKLRVQAQLRLSRKVANNWEKFRESLSFMKVSADACKINKWIRTE